jgi:hypothetical protein
MTEDPIIEDVRAEREKLLDACNGDLDLLLDRLKEQEKQDRSRVVSQKVVRAKRTTSPAASGHSEIASDSMSMPKGGL